ncbi:O-fucosyltransferase family protein [Paenibacillus farraposensis]|uniref:O-fucosyltransferase family protein n=1 Tax=Paenibacillus farraposensis TaxID=2807095 RepID=A0ABW4DFP9_9BACL|nr:O-fucosyltransferase family protein [Paenibacillus farraposensis]MCC3380785.1 O-fucosyltransferase family protein [Paenibacillus farraposensis]
MRFLLIKGYSHSILMDIRQLLNYIVVADLSNRVPVVHWGSSSFYNGKIYNNAFNMYFEPVSDYTIEDLMKPEYSFFPSVWNYENLLIPDPGLASFTDRSIGEILESEADVVVCDLYPNKMPVQELIGEQHPLYGMEARQMYRYLIKKYLKLKPDITRKISQFFYTHSLHEGPTLALHVRGEVALDEITSRFSYSSYNSKFKIKYKPFRNTNDTLLLHQPYRIHKVGRDMTSNKIYHKEIQFMLGKYSIKKLFLMTDSTKIIEEYKQLYGTMLVHTDAPRQDDDELVPYLETHMHRRQNGIDAILEAYIAANCSFFLGDGHSEISHGVTYLKDWPNTNFKLMYWVSETSDIAKFNEVKTIVYPQNEFVGKARQMQLELSRIWNRFKGR